ncbi:alpha/beta fold hydrolase [Mameliella sediminis]|uniref:alpha/beta fold hydrolase n=1 Tax=Mameliella sediminis TaxID=2836866 RepID=UPI001C44C0D3|nr:alpha/beta hydrolase [Mameliella sediminis]MBV7395145.1 alpha/beta hydrolase [Mameliella sediminis]MBY6159659.1 alpha/beta hydrolase [Mameliella alba]MBY6168130.1 alpha/beta hydrolase [Mameliella alba]MBY6173151.1 alpha/beta hydrolase [Mameliella alba]
MTFELEMRGEGPPVLFLPGSYSTSRVWAGIFDRLTGVRCLSVSLPGYGSTAERRRPEACRMAELTGFVGEIAAEIGQPFHLVGHSFGGQIALAAALAGDLPILSVVSFEGNVVFGRRDGEDFPWRDGLTQLVNRFSAAVAAGDPEAPGLIIDYWSRPGVFAGMPDPVRAFCAQGAGTNLLDWRTARDFTPCFADFQTLPMPCTICRGEHASPAIVDVSAELVNAIPESRLDVVEGADHFLVSTHPEACAAIITAHLRRVGALD